MKLKRLKNQKGLSLVELLATLAILSIIGGLIMGIIITSMNNYQSIEAKNHLKTKANQILLQMTNIHQNSKGYMIEYVDDETFQINYTDQNDACKTTLVETNGVQYELMITSGGVERILESDQPIPNNLTSSEKSINVDLTLSTENDERTIDFSIETIISRMLAVNGGSATTCASSG